MTCDRKDVLGTHLWKIDQSRSKLWDDKVNFSQVKAVPIPGAMIWKEAGCVWVNEQLDNFQIELARATWKVVSSRVN